jgi:hypothetical protein
MNDLQDDEVREIAAIFVNLGAVETSAQVMAAQLLKRAGQIAEARDISKLEAVETLLKQVVEARQGA